MKSVLSIMITLCSLCSVAQNVGINVSSPVTTLHIAGVPSSTTAADGVLIPNLTGDQLKAKDAVYTATQRGTFLYVSAAVTTSSAKTINVTAAGLYYFDGTVWQRAGIALTGDITPDALVNDAANTMVKLGTKSDGLTARDAATDFVVKDDGKMGIGTASPTEKLTVASGNISTTGWARGTAAGQLLNTVFVPSPTLLLTNTSSIIFVDLISYSYTPVSASSKILIKYNNNNYVISGTASSLSADEFQSQVLIGASAIPTTNAQSPSRGTITDYQNNQFRTGTLFPIAAAYTNTATTALTIKVQIRRSLGDDDITFTGNNGTLVIQEIAN